MLISLKNVKLVAIFNMATKSSIPVTTFVSKPATFVPN